MNYFKYSKVVDINRSIEVYNVVQSLKNYAIAIYKNLWEDALDKAYFHILENFNWDSESDLSHYATKTVAKILLNKNLHEFTHDTALQTAMDKKSLGALGLDPAEVLVTEVNSVSTSEKECIDYLLPMFVSDYKFFKSMKPEDRTVSYNGLFEKFSAKTVVKTVNYLVGNYGKSMEELLEIKQKSHFRNFPKDRYKNNLDPTVEFNCVFKNVIIYKSVSGRMNRHFYVVDLKKVLDNLVHTYFIEDCVRRIGDCNVYCTLSGNLIMGESALLSTLEREVVGAILARTQGIRVVSYSEGDRLILSSSKDNSEIMLNIWDKPFNIEMQPLVAKCVGRKE